MLSVPKYVTSKWTDVGVQWTRSHVDGCSSGLI
jgi:hypothetical protein